MTSSENLQKDLLDYINFRLSNSPSIQSNVASTSGKLDGSSSSQFRFSHHLLGLSKGSFLFAKLTLDLLERGHLVAKSSGYKVSHFFPSLTDILFRARGKESTEVRKSQIKGKESENLPGIEEITEGQAHKNTLKLYRDILTGTAVFLNRKKVFTLFRLRKTAVSVKIF